ncbi:DUF4199 domain-containing protein [Moheibacter sediminis]|nr:DUF4199 domain-containing protein [Moheibacter sediminis]
MARFKFEMKWALIFIIMSLLWMVLEKLSGLHGKYIDYHLYLTNLYAIPAIAVFVFALKDIRKNYYNGQMNFKQGFVSGMIITVIVTIFAPLTQWIISYIISPEYFPNVIKRSVELGYYKTTTEATANFNYKNYAVQSTIASFMMGIITTLVVAYFVRTKTVKN